MKHFTGILVLLPLAFLAACASAAPPKPDPLREQIPILQKQLLELQKLQSETKTKLDDSTAVIDALSAKIKALEEKQDQLSAPKIASAPASTVQPSGKKTAKKVKKKKVRRQE